MAKKVNKNVKTVLILIVLAVIVLFFYGNASGIDFSEIFASNAAKPDLTPVSVKFNAATAIQVASTTVAVKNQGTANAANVEVLVKDAFDNVLGTCIISEIKVGETKSCDATFSGMYVPNYEHAYVDYNRKISELDEKNNDMSAENF